MADLSGPKGPNKAKMVKAFTKVLAAYRNNLEAEILAEITGSATITDFGTGTSPTVTLPKSILDELSRKNRLSYQGRPDIHRHTEKIAGELAEAVSRL